MDTMTQDMLVMKTMCELLEHANLNWVDVRQLTEPCAQLGIMEEELRSSIASLARQSFIASPSSLTGIQLESFSLTLNGFEHYITSFRPDLMALPDAVANYLRVHPKFQHDERVSGGEIASQFGISPVFSNLILEMLSSRGLITILKLGRSGQVLLVTGLGDRRIGASPA